MYLVKDPCRRFTICHMHWQLKCWIYLILCILLLSSTSSAISTNPVLLHLDLNEQSCIKFDNLLHLHEKLSILIIFINDKYYMLTSNGCWENNSKSSTQSARLNLVTVWLYSHVANYSKMYISRNMLWVDSRVNIFPKFRHSASTEYTIHNTQCRIHNIYSFSARISSCVNRRFTLYRTHSEWKCFRALIYI